MGKNGRILPKSGFIFYDSRMRAVKLITGGFLILTAFSAPARAEIPAYSQFTDEVTQGVTAYYARLCDEALAYLMLPADHGNATAQNYLGKLYEEGCGVPQDGEKAVYWYTKSADQNNPGSWLSLANIYRQGNGVAKDPMEAVRWLRKGVDDGDLEAMVQLGMMFQNGEGVYQDYEAALRLYQQAVDVGYPPAMRQLATMHEQGLGMPQNTQEASRLRQVAGPDPNDLAAVAALEGACTVPVTE